MQGKTLIRTAVLAMACIATIAFSPRIFAQGYPARPVRMVIPFPPGGTLDTVGRLLAQKLAAQLHQPFVVENKPGGNGIIGAETVAKAPADGYTLLFNASTFVTAPMTMPSTPYNVIKDFSPISLVAKAPLSVAINKNLPITDIKTLVAYAKANPAKLTFAVGSVGSAGHLATEMLKRADNLDFTIVRYKGTAPAFQDLVGGQIAGFVDPILGSLQYHKAGMLRVVAVTSKSRTPNLPEVPTVAETIPGFEAYSWYGMWGPARLPADITLRINGEINKALAELNEKLTAQGLLMTPGNVEDFVKFQRDDMAKAQKIITEGNIRVE